MKITVFTGNEPRHISLIENLASIADTVYSIQECKTVFPGQVADFHCKSVIMQDYFSRVHAAECRVFGDLRFLPTNVRSLSLKLGDLSLIDPNMFREAMNSDLFLVFGTGMIKGSLLDALLERRAINIHMGVSPYYRGSSCNFWALYDGNIDLVGATVHRLSEGLDSGDILFHAMPEPQNVDPFDMGMLAVRAVHDVVIEEIRNGRIFSIEPVKQDLNQEIRYSRSEEFTDEVASEYLARKIGPEDVYASYMAAPDRTLRLCKDL